ncbi:hypothetical protein Glove_232g151 [Diversispora epigaea]|uniref:BTB domain-containing protein n=1 Tax=Diversispora epigaea TaxID=1348612 RepID=A0A397IG48_9GLOM|nr:hypothetical protein Glove_232g151 [Diversispora epigaea]
MSFKFFDKLSQDFSELLNDRKEYNVVIEVDKEENMKSFTTHSVVLRYRSSYFDKELENAPANENHIKTIIKPNISAQLFEIILKYIYGGIVDIKNTDTKTINELMINANELELKELSRKLESYLIKSKASWLRTHFSLVYRSIFDSNEFKGLKKFYNDIIVKYPNLIFESEDFTSLQETALISILKRDDLQIEEIKIWDYLIKWGIAQNPILPTDLKEWSKKNFKALKKTLQQCLPLIRYFHIPGEVIWEKPITSLVLPARIISNPELPSTNILTPELPSTDISTPELPSADISTPELPSRTTSTLELPLRVNEPFSTIINKEYVAEISSWVDQKLTIYSLTHIPFAGTDEIVGGYNPLAWDNSRTGNVETNDSFIFSLKNGNIQNSILSRVKPNSGGALYYPMNQSMYDPWFGFSEFSMDSKVSNFTQDKMCQCNGISCYENPIRTTKDGFSIVDYEVFKIQ